MKTFTHIIIAFFAFSSSCGNQEINQNITLNYNAQTRGYSYKISLVNYSLEINNNNSIKTATLDKSHLIKIEDLMSSIDFNEFKDTVSNEDLAVDKVIKGVFTGSVNTKTYKAELDHNNLPEQLKALFTYLESLTK